MNIIEKKSMHSNMNQHKLNMLEDIINKLDYAI